jgi:putative transposase
MPRLARLDAPGVLHHIIIRGIERRQIFRDDKDRDNLVGRLSKFLPETRTTCYAWTLLPNHAHFLLRSGDVGLPTLMRRLLTGYAVSFNRRHHRHGPLFQNRYKSIICQEDVYLKELVRYIHLNPLRARVVADLKVLGEYPYCGHSVLMGRNERPWQDTSYVLSYFGGRIREAREHYLSYILAGKDQGRRPELVGGGLIRSLGGWEEVKKIPLKGQSRIKGDERILGESDFVMEVLSLAKQKYSRQYEFKRLGYDIQKVAVVVARIYEIDPKYLFSKGRQRTKVEARSLLCYWAARELGMSLTDIGKYLDMSPPGVGYAVERGEIIAGKNNYQMIE